MDFVFQHTIPHGLQNKWIGENVGIAPDIEQKITSLPYGRGVTCNWSVG